MDDLKIIGFYCPVCDRDTIFYHRSRWKHNTIPYNKDGQFMFDFVIRTSNGQS